MQLFTSPSPLVWGELDLPLLGIRKDWFGNSLDPPACFTLAADPLNLWFVATRQVRALSHPDSKPHRFTPELWKYDAAELFLADPATGRYLEFNLAPNAAWWAAAFSAPRVPAPRQPDFPSRISSLHETQTDGSWLAALVVPLEFLRAEIGFGAATTANVAFILNSPSQSFHSAHPLPGAQPDFHRPGDFPRLEARGLPDH